MSKAYLIDVAAQVVREVEYDSTPGSNAIHEMIGGHLEAAAYWPSGDALYVDEEGLLKSAAGYFMVDGVREDQLLAGNGVIVGREIEDKEGAWTGTADPSFPLDFIAPRVRFYTRAQARAWGRGNASDPASTTSFVGEDGVLHHEVHARMGPLYERATRDPEDRS